MLRSKEGRINIRDGRLIVHPYRTDDPYLNLLHLAPRAAGWQIRTSSRFEAFLEHLAKVESGDVVHLHWTSSIVQAAESEVEAAERLSQFCRSLDAALANGGLLIWTMHSLLPLDCAYPGLELELVQVLADRAQAIHVLSEAARAQLMLRHAVPAARIVHLPRASYAGIYDTSLTRDEARSKLSIAEHEKVVLFFGRASESKGLGKLLSAIQDAGTGGVPLVLLLAGVLPEHELPWLESRLPRNVRVIRDHRRVPDEELQEWFAGADVAVVPHRNALASGVVYLAATFGLPVILPRPERSPRAGADERWITFYDEGETNHNLKTAIIDFDDQHGEQRDAALAFARGHTPFDMSRDYLAALNAEPKAASTL